MTENDYGKMVFKPIYNKILKASSSGYMHQNCGISFDYAVDYEYLSDSEKIMLLNQFGQIQNENETQTFINATNWVSRILLSDQNGTIEPISGYELIRKVKERIYAANCYAHAVVLNDVFRLLGYTSKYVFCMPVDYHFSDNHVVNLVYSKQQHKWMLFDAAQNVYYTNENGVILDIQELRRCFIEDRHINVCLLDAYWSDLGKKERIMFQNRNLVYMMKNTYRFSCFKNSYVDRLATNRKVIHYHLVPANYMQTPFTQVFYNMRTATKHIEVYSSDEAAFWSVPKEDDI